MPDQTALQELVALLREKGYALDMSIYGGPHLDTYLGGVRLTGMAEDSDPETFVAQAVDVWRDEEPNPARR